MLTVQEITTLEALKEFAPQWEALLHRHSIHDLFRTPQWSITWWEAMRPERRTLLVLAVHDGKDLLGVAPMMAVRDSVAGLPVTRIEFISTWKFAGSASSCLGEMDFVAPERPGEVIDAVVSHLVRLPLRWDLLRLHPVPSASPTRALLEEAGRRYGLALRATAVLPAHAIVPDRAAGDFLSSLSPKFRKTLKETERKLARYGTAEFVELRTADGLEEAIGDIIAVERQSWKWTTGVAINSTVFRDFYPRLIRTAAAKGWLSLWFLVINGRKAAYGIFMRVGLRVAYLKTAYDGRFHPFSPGALILWKAAERFQSDGASVIDLFAGNAEQKHRWGTRSDEHAELLMVRDSSRSRFLDALLYRFALYDGVIMLSTLVKRLLRKLGLHPHGSELSRMDQVSTGPWT